MAVAKVNTTTKTSALFVVNKRSGQADAVLGPALDRLTSSGIDVIPLAPQDPAHIDRIIDRESKDKNLLIIGGGDGTISGAAKSVLNSGLPLGILPMGTANDFARSLGIPTDLEDAAAVISAGYRRRVDVGLVNGRPFLNVASIGFGAEVARFHKGTWKDRLGRFAYPLTWIDAFRNHQSFRAQIVSDGVRITCRCVQISVGSGRHYGGGLTIAADAEVDDGWLRIYYVKPLSVWGWMRLIPSLRLGTLGARPEVELTRAKDVLIETSRPKTINVDGELVEQTPARFEIRARALAVFAPVPARADSRKPDLDS